MDMFEYQRNLDSLSFTPEQKSKLAAKAVLAAEQKPQKHSFRILKTAAAAFCLLFALTITAEAAGVQTPLSEFLAPIFGGTVAQTEIIDKIGRPINASDTDNGVTIQADAIIGDAYNLCIVYTIRRDDGTALLPKNVSGKDLFLGTGSEFTYSKPLSGHGRIRFADNLPGDDAVRFFYTLSSEKPLNHVTATADIHDLSYIDWSVPYEEGDTIQRLTAVKGHWKLRFDIDYDDSSIQLGGGETFTQDGLNFTITDLRISPIGIKADYEVDSEMKQSNASNGRLSEEDRLEEESNVENVEVLLHKKNGTVLPVTGGVSIEHPKTGKTYVSKSTVFDEIIPLEELESISVGGVVYPIPNN